MNYTSIAHWPNLERHGAFLVSRNKVGGVTWVKIYRGEPSRCEYVAQFRQGKKYLSHYITGKRFASVEAAVRFYGAQEGGAR